MIALAKLKNIHFKTIKHSALKKKVCILLWVVNMYYHIKGHQYSAGTSFSAPRSITEKPMEDYYLDEWIIITLHVAGFLHPALF